MRSFSIIVLGAALYTACINCSAQSTEQVCFKQQCFSVEVARTPQQRACGLMFRHHLDKREGMLFIFEEEGLHPFWMKDTPIPLDIIWLGRDKKVVFIEHDAQPCTNGSCVSFCPGQKARYVIELNAGTAATLGLRVGDAAAFSVQ